MTPLERGSLHLTALLAGLSGLAYGGLKYFGQRLGEFGPEPHPMQGLAQHSHLLLSPLLVFTLGIMVRAHVVPALQGGRVRGRATGLALALILGPMVLTGYGLQACVDPHWRLAMAWLHGSSSVLFLTAYAAHLLRSRLAARAMNTPPKVLTKSRESGDAQMRSERTPTSA